jgi:hypothetical protein
MIITIIDTSKNQPKDLDSDNQINVSRLIVYLAAKKENIGSPEKRSATEEESRTIKRQRSTSAPAGSVVDGTSTEVRYIDIGTKGRTGTGRNTGLHRCHPHRATFGSYQGGETVTC